MWVKVQTSVGSNVTCYAVNADTGVALWVRQNDTEFRIELEVPVGVDASGNLIRHLPLLQICDTQEEADEKVNDLLNAVEAGENLFEI
ncbi:hypothetical protein F4083_02315 [Candidatus Poribacteria bacterium]|nr:hypothetical protein [Candidatus Poribacteria bacterium]MYI93144.1 hypothetical protein [Candidatus Poribacteria bacterium]